MTQHKNEGFVIPKSNQIWIKFYRNGKSISNHTFAESKSEVEKLKKYFKLKGIGEDSRVIIKMRNSPQLAFTFLALYQLRAIVIPVHYNEDTDRLNFIIDDSLSSFLITKERVKLLKQKSKRDTILLPLNTSTIIYTSGTTGFPKGVCLTIRNWYENAIMLTKHHKFDAKSIFASPLLLSHCNAHGLAMFTTLYARSTYIMFDSLPKNFLDIISKEKVTVTSVVPTILNRLYVSDPDWKPSLHLKYFLSAAAPLTGDLLKRILEGWGIIVIQGYGLSESTNFSCTMPVGLSKKQYTKVMFPHPSIGVSLEKVRVRLRKIDKIKKEVLISAPTNFSGYLNSGSNKFQRTVATGDIGYSKTFLGRRFYYLTGRAKELINRGGIKIHPIEIERKLSKLGLNGEFAIFGIPDKTLGEEVVIAVTPTVQNLGLLKAVPKFMQPKEIIKVSTLPYTLTGKLQRKALLRIYLSQIN
jgi:long-chain acyl-CoA synthetase